MKTRFLVLLVAVMLNAVAYAQLIPSWEYNGIYYEVIGDTTVQGEPFPGHFVKVTTKYENDSPNGTMGSAHQVFGLYSGDIVIPESFRVSNAHYFVKAIDNCAFQFCDVTSVTMPNSVKWIGQNAFHACLFLKSLIIPDGVDSIAPKAFNHCLYLEHVKVGKNLKTIASDAFYDCNKIKSVEWNASWCWNVSKNLFPQSLETITFSDNVIVIPRYICWSKTNLSNVTISDNVTIIGTQAFYYCSNLINLHFPNSLNEIESKAFANTGLWSITIPEPVYDVAEDAFEGCCPTDIYWNSVYTGTGIGYVNFGPSVQRIYFGDNVQMIPPLICKNKAYLEEVHISSSVTSIRESAFYGCTNLQTVYLGGARLESIGQDAFYNCANLSSDLILPRNLQTIGSNAFYGCAKIPSVMIPQSLQSIGTGAFYGCTNLKKVYNSSTMTLVPGSSSQGYVAYYADYVYNNLEWQGDYLFSQSLNADERYLLLGYVGNGTDLVLPNTYKNSEYCIEQCAFMNAVQITSVTIPNSVTKIKEAAFYGCTGLTSVTIPSSVTYVGQTAYEDCVNINEIHCESQTPPTAFANTFTNVPKTIPLYIPAGSLSAYSNAPGWKLFTNVVETDLVNPTGVSLQESTLNLMKGEEALLHASVSPSDATYKTLTWSSSDNTIATVTNGVVYGKKPGNATITCTTTHGGFTATCDVTVQEHATLATGMQIYKSAYLNGNNLVPFSEMEEGDTLTFMELGTGFIVINVLPYNVTNGEITWIVSDPSIVATEYSEHINFANSITIKPLHVGTTKITISTTDGSNISKNVYVDITPDPNPTIQVRGVRCLPREITIGTGEKDTIDALVLPLDATNTTVYWSRTSGGNPLTISIKTVEGKRCEITAKSAGTAYVYVETSDGKYKDTCTVTIIKKVPVTGLSLNKTSKTLNVGETFQLTPVFTPSNATNQNVYWMMDNDSVATIENGLVTAIQEGAVTITCVSEDGNYKATCVVSVINDAPVSVTGVSLNKKTLQMVIGNTATVTASVLPDNASNKSVTWTSSNTATATVSSTGTISAKAEGVTTITCKTVDGNFTAECYVVVSAANSEYTFSYEPTNATVINYTATELSYNEIPENNCVFAALADNAHTLNLMYVGSLVNGVIPQGNYKITSTLQNGTFCYPVGGDDQYDYGSYMATDFDSEGYYTSAYYIIAGDITIGSKNNYTVKVVSANGTDINVTYNDTQDIEIVPSKTKASKILRNGQIFILRGEKVYTITGQEVR